MENVEQWRPRNETDADRANENVASDILESIWGLQLIKLSEQLYGIDWVLCACERVHGFAEFKCRKNTYYDELLLSSAKFWKLKYLHQYSSLPCYIIVEWKTGIYVADVDKFSSPYLQLAGNNRGQNGDIEPCVFLPMKDFELVYKK